MIILALMKQPALTMKVTLSVLVLKDIMEMENTIVAVSAHFSFCKIHTLGYVFKRLTILYLLINDIKGRFCSLPFVCTIQSYSGGMFKLVNRNFNQKCDCDLHLNCGFCFVLQLTDLPQTGLQKSGLSWLS